MASEIPIQSIGRCMSVLEYLAGKRTASLEEVAESASVNKTTAYNILRSLIGCGYVAKGEGRGYALTDKFGDLQTLSVLTLEKRQAIEQRLSRFTSQFGELISLTMLFDGARRRVCFIDGTQVLKINVEADDRPHLNPFTYTTGRAMLALAPPDQLTRARQRFAFPNPKWTDVTDDDGLRRFCREIAASGVYRSETPVFFSLVVPFRHGDHVFALGTAVPHSRGCEAYETELLAMLQEVAEDVRNIL
jgi:DNA-binding IclR family transcriptional regulator